MLRRIEFPFYLQLAFAVVMVLATAISGAGQAPVAQAASAPQAMTVLELRAEHATISVANIDNERNWYRDKLGFTQTRHIERGPDFEIWQLTIPGYRMDLVRVTGSQRPKSPTPLYLQQGWVHITFSTPDIAKSYEFLKTAGTDVKADLNDHNAITRLVLHDPEGNEIEIFPR